MTEKILWCLLAAVCYFAGRYDLCREIESNGWDMDWLTPSRIRLTRRPAPSSPRSRRMDKHQETVEALMRDWADDNITDGAMGTQILAALRSAAADAVATISNGIDADPHQWSKWPCSTCSEITKKVGVDFGCVSYAKSTLGYSEYAKAAALRSPSRSAEKTP